MDTFIDLLRVFAGVFPVTYITSAGMPDPNGNGGGLKTPKQLLVSTPLYLRTGFILVLLKGIGAYSSIQDKLGDNLFYFGGAAVLTYGLRKLRHFAFFLPGANLLGPVMFD